MCDIEMTRGILARRLGLCLALGTFLWGISARGYWIRRHSQRTAISRHMRCADNPALRSPILVSYAYYEKEPVLQHHLVRDTQTQIEGVSEIWRKGGVVMLKRVKNEGMDFAAHNVTIQWTHTTGRQKLYNTYFFINSSVRGPFFPSYMGQAWQWTQAFTERMDDDVRVVASSLVCLPGMDAGGYGPKVESWAFAVDLVALKLLIEAGVFNSRVCKLCDDGIVVKGEYGISNTILNAGYNIATLMSMYPVGVDWRDESHWHCNNNTHPSRRGTYDGISMHPFETVFLKASWHVGEPYTSHYTRWNLARATGDSNTAGTFDESQYYYAISKLAEEPEHV
ncbi:g5375 [Coccomyxa elongata]